MAELDEPVRDLRERIDRAARVCVLSGAGMSAESGIATFRDALTGLWSRFDPAQLASVEGFRADPPLVWDWYAERREGVRAAQPNAGHLALGAFARRRPGVLTVVTQNVDDLHQRAGNLDTIRLHGDILLDQWLQGCGRGRACNASRAEAGRPPEDEAVRAMAAMLAAAVQLRHATLAEWVLADRAPADVERGVRAVAEEAIARVARAFPDLDVPRAAPAAEAAAG